MVEQAAETAMSALISAIIPAFNHEPFVQAALRSLIAQTHQRMELIVQDDGSTDETYSRLEELRPELEKRFVRVRISRKSNEGSAATIASCLKLAESDLVYL